MSKTRKTRKKRCEGCMECELSMLCFSGIMNIIAGKCVRCETHGMYELNDAFFEQLEEQRYVNTYALGRLVNTKENACTRDAVYGVRTTILMCNDCLTKVIKGKSIL